MLNVINKFKNDELCIQVDTKKGGLASYIYADTTLTARSKHSIKEAQELKFCFALSFAMVQLKQEGRMLKTLKETTTIEQDMGTYGDGEWIA